MVGAGRCLPLREQVAAECLEFVVVLVGGFCVRKSGVGCRHVDVFSLAVIRIRASFGTLAGLKVVWHRGASQGGGGVSTLASKRDTRFVTP
jgi:hypothetical protein